MPLTGLERMKGMDLKSIKANPALIPLFFFVGAGSLMAGLYVLRLATQHPEVAWTRGTHGRPWDEYKNNKRYKLWSESVDYKTLPKSPEPVLPEPQYQT